MANKRFMNRIKDNDAPEVDPFLDEGAQDEIQEKSIGLGSPFSESEIEGATSLHDDSFNGDLFDSSEEEEEETIPVMDDIPMPEPAPVPVPERRSPEPKPEHESSMADFNNDSDQGSSVSRPYTQPIRPQTQPNGMWDVRGGIGAYGSSPQDAGVAMKVLDYVCKATVENLKTSYNSEIYTQKYMEKLFQQYVDGKTDASNPLFKQLVEECVQAQVQDPYLKDLTTTVLQYIGGIS